LYLVASGVVHLNYLKFEGPVHRNLRRRRGGQRDGGVSALLDLQRHCFRKFFGTDCVLFKALWENPQRKNWQ